MRCSVDSGGWRSERRVCRRQPPDVMRSAWGELAFRRKMRGDRRLWTQLTGGRRLFIARCFCWKHNVRDCSTEGSPGSLPGGREAALAGPRSSIWTPPPGARAARGPDKQSRLAPHFRRQLRSPGPCFFGNEGHTSPGRHSLWLLPNKRPMQHWPVWLSG